jgi:hypothetical protein
MDVLKQKVRIFLLSKNWDTITANDWTTLELNALEANMLKALGRGCKINDLANSSIHKGQIDCLRAAVGLVSISQQANENATTRRKARMAEYLKAQNREKEAQNHAREILNRLAKEEEMKREEIDRIESEHNLVSSLLKNGSSGGGASRKRKGRKSRKASRKTARKMRR